MIPLLIPKDISIIEYSIRPAAIWSLGKIYEDKQLPDNFGKQLLARMRDVNPNAPESQYVRTMCAFTFAVTNYQTAKSSLEEFAIEAGRTSRFGFNCNWALNRMTGRPIPKLTKIIRPEKDWFLVPIE